MGSCVSDFDGFQPLIGEPVQGGGSGAIQEEQLALGILSLTDIAR